MAELAKQLLAALAVAGAEGVATLLNGGTLDDAFAKSLEVLSDQRAQSKQFPDGRYVP